MRRFRALGFLLAALLLDACQTTGISNLSPQEPAGRSESTSSTLLAWNTYRDGAIGIRVDYPLSGYVMTPVPFRGADATTYVRLDDYSQPVDEDFRSGSYQEMEDHIQVGNDRIAIEGIRIGQSSPEGNLVQIYRTKDKRILKYVQRDQLFTGGLTVKGTFYQRFEVAGARQEYGYVGLKNGYYYVFESRWGPDNLVAERMFQSLAIQ